MSTPYEPEIRRACGGDELDQARAFEICDKVAAEGSEGAQQLAQALIARYHRYPDISDKTRLLELMDILVVNCDDTFHLRLTEEDFFQTLISDKKVQSDQHFRTTVQTHLSAWLGSFSGKASEIASDIFQRLLDSAEEESLDRQPGSSNPRGPSDQLLTRGPREVITFKTPKLEKRLCRFLLSSYVQAGDILRTSRRVKWFSLQAIHIARQAFHLIIRFNDFIGPDGPTEAQCDEGMDLDDALEELEDKVDELEKLNLEEAIQCEEDHKYDLSRLYQIFFLTRDFYPNGRDHTTDPVLKRLVDSDHATLILTRRLQARGPYTEGFQILDVHDDDDDDGGNQGHISDVSVSRAEPDEKETVLAMSTDSAPLTEEQLVSTAPFASEGSVGNVTLVDPQSQPAVQGTQTTITEGQQQEGTTEVVAEEEEGIEDEPTQATSLGAAPLARGRDEDDDDPPPEQKFKCTVPGCDKKFSEHHELKAHIHEHDDKPYGCTMKGCYRTYSTQRERDRHVSIHRLTLQFGLPGFGSPGKTTTTETTATDPTSSTQTQVSAALPSVLISASASSNVNPPAADGQELGNPPQA